MIIVYTERSLSLAALFMAKGVRFCSVASEQLATRIYFHIVYIVFNDLKPLQQPATPARQSQKEIANVNKYINMLL